MSESDQIVSFTYVNWSGQTSLRHVMPRTICFGATEWHPVRQWLLQAWDLDRQAQRTFALKDIRDWSPVEVQS